MKGYVVLMAATILGVAAGCGVSAAGSSDRLQQPGTPAFTWMSLVLSQKDVGVGYAPGRPVPGRVSLSQVASGDSPAVTNLIKQDWVGSYAVGFPPSDLRLPGVWVAANVFRSSRHFRQIGNAWRADAIRQLDGTALPVPAALPGRPLWFIRGHFRIAGQRRTVLGYGWQEGRAIGQLTVTGKPTRTLYAQLAHVARKEADRLRAQRSAGGPAT